MLNIKIIWLSKRFGRSNVLKRSGRVVRDKLNTKNKKLCMQTLEFIVI